MPAVLARLALVAACAAALPVHAAEVDADQVAAGIYERINALRAQAGLAAVRPEPHLEAAARDFARFMAASGRYGHEADGHSPPQRARAHGYDYCIVSENIAYEYSSSGFTASGLVDGFATGWAQSPPHRRNLLDAAVADTGAAVAQGKPDGRYYAVQMFGLPAGRMAHFELTNRAGVAVSYRIAGRRYRLAPRETATHGQCRPGAVTFEWPGGQAAGRIEPAAGGRYVVTRSQTGTWTVAPRD